MSESLNKTSQKDQTTDETTDSWADLENANPTKEDLVAPLNDEATVEELSFLFENVDDDDKIEDYTKQE
ncbi:hypothetical protein LJC64_03355 [Ruminococcaceae bacterium OttesenSCG-928-A11]|nr:hypothetical protein [Ruminococcaceae bacterium OttesenSCG-928-A11]